MNILIKLTCLIGLVIAPILGEDMAVANTPEVEEVTLIMEQEEKATEVEVQFSADKNEELEAAAKIAESVSELKAVNAKQNSAETSQKE